MLSFFLKFSVFCIVDHCLPCFLYLSATVMFIISPLHRRGYTVLPLSVLPSVCPSATIDGRNLIFGHKVHEGMSYCGKRFWSRHIPTSCLVFIHIEYIYGGIVSEH